MIFSVAPTTPNVFTLREMKKEISFSKLWWLAAGAFAALYWLPGLFEHGLFIDGIYYGMQAQNLANGKATWFHLHGTSGLGTDFFGNPPMHIWILSLFFQLFHSAFFTEKFYSLLTFVATAFLLSRLWKLEFKNHVIGRETNDGSDNSALPILFFLFIPLVPWCYSNNLMENTMTIFTTASVYFIARFSSTQKNIFLFSFLSSVFIFFGVLTKALPALFPLAAPVFILVGRKSFSPMKIISFCALQIIFLSTFCFVLFSFPDAKNYLNMYREEQLAPLFSHTLDNSKSNFSILYDLFCQLIPLLIIVLLSLIISRKQKIKNSNTLRYFLIALAASLPVMITRKQSFFYLLPSLPFFAMTASLFVEEQKEKVFSVLKLKNFQRIKFITAISFSIVIVAMISLSVFNYGKISRDEAKLHDIFSLKNEVSSDKKVFISLDIVQDYSLHAYMWRYYETSCVPVNFESEHILLAGKNSLVMISADSISLIKKGEEYDIYKMK